MNSADVMTVSALVVILSYAYDLVNKLIKRRRQLTADERADYEEPLAIRRQVLDNVRTATDLQSALMLNLRQDVDRMRLEKEQAETALAEVNRMRQAERQESGRLYAEIVRLQGLLNERRGGVES